MRDRRVLRAGGAAAIAGAVVGLAANSLRPLPLGLETRGVLRQIAATGRWEAVHVLLLAAVALIVLGLVVAAASMASGPSRPAAVVGLVPLLLGGAIAVAATAVDAFARRRAALAWANAPAGERGAAFRVAEAVDLVWFAVFAAWVVLLLGAAPAIIGIAQIRSPHWPTWLGIAGTAAGLPVGVLGLLLLLEGGRDPFYVALAALTGVITVWVGITGMVLWRGGRENGG